MMTDYERILIKEINKLKEENNKLLKENNELKNKNNNNIKKNNIDNNDYKINNNNEIDQLSRSSRLINPSPNLINSSQMNQNNNQNPKNNLSKSINNNILKSASLTQPKGDNNIPPQNPDLNLSILCNLNFKNYPMIQLSANPFSKIIGYGANSYNGTVRQYNEDRIKIILDHKTNKSCSINGKVINPNISYFAIYDGHGGNGCTNFLQENLHNYIFNSEFFPQKPLGAIYQAYEKAE